MKLAWIRDHQKQFGVLRPCKLLGVGRSTFYDWRDRPASPRIERNQMILHAIEREHAASRRTYGSPRIHQALLGQQIAVCRNTVAKLMKKAGIRSIRSRRFRVMTTQSNHAYHPAPNRINQQFVALKPNQKWLCDITYIPTREGTLHLASVLDVCSRKIVGWQIADHLKTSLCLEALQMALDQRRPTKGLIHHSDRGVQYACDDYRRLLRDHGITVSMSRSGNCWDNAMMESFHATYKTELLYPQPGGMFQFKEEARRKTFEWIEVFYNRLRRHSAIGYQSPEQFEASRN